ncbi:MAG: EscU/YscU/HrcU family type III secretion system export apparatus switch protein [Spirochaetales bacterium]|nr:EscU/YscU/HrcU family type III secretion system export apparatus switch protein [Spirochaetales bacterium]MCF7937435.1 EscU/YscU/HrcU family type III secretion system export apparatus switch protein [Spirochaetales bacterium]
MGKEKDRAVAVKYDPSLPAPFVSAKGAGRLAERIRELAREYDVAVLDEPELTEGLYELDIYEQVPERYYQILASILVYINRVKEKI